MNKKIIILIVLVSILCIIATCLFRQKKSIPTPTIPPKEQLSTQIVVKPKVINYEYDSRRVSLRIPQVETTNSSFNTYVNNRISMEMDVDKVYAETTAGMNKDSIGMFYYEVDYDRFDCFDYLSLVCTQNIQLVPDRKITKTKTYNIDVKKNTLCEIKDVFANKGFFMTKLKEEVLSQSEEKGIELKDGGNFLSISDTQCFYIKDFKLHLVFEPGEIAAVAFGELDYEIPFENENGLFVF